MTTPDMGPVTPMGYIALDAITINPRIADAVPPLSDTKYGELLEAIKRDGQQVVVDLAKIDGVLTMVEGHNRLRVISEIKLPGILSQFRPAITTVDEAIYFTRMSNLHRRQLTARQDQALAKRVAEHAMNGVSIRDIAVRERISKSGVARLLDQLSQAGTVDLPDTSKGLDGRMRKSRKQKGSDGPKPTGFVLGPVGQLAEADGKKMAIEVRQEKLEHHISEAEAARGVLHDYIEALTDRIFKREGVEYPPRGKTEYKRRSSKDPVAETVTTAVGKLVKDENGKAIAIVPEPRLGDVPETMSASEYLAKYPGTTMRELRQIGREQNVLRSLHDTKLDFIAKLDAAGVRFPAVLGLGGASS